MGSDIRLIYDTHVIQRDGPGGCRSRSLGGGDTAQGLLGPVIALGFFNKGLQTYITHTSQSVILSGGCIFANIQYPVGNNDKLRLTRRSLIHRRYIFHIPRPIRRNLIVLCFSFRKHTSFPLLDPKTRFATGIRV